MSRDAKSHRGLAVLIGCALQVGAWSLPAAAQTPPTLHILDVRSTPRGVTELVASVLDHQGTPVRDLSRSNFELRVEGREVSDFSVEPVSSNDSPLSVVLGIDISGSMRGAPIDEAKKAAATFVDQLEKGDFLSLMTFGSDVTFATDFTTARHEVRERLQALSARDAKTWLYQATAEGVERAGRAPTSRVALVLLTDGKDEGSPRTVDDVLDRLKASPVPIFTLGFGSGADIEYLRRVATLSGATFLFTPEPDQLTALYGRVLDQLKNQYLVRFNLEAPAGRYTTTLTLQHRGAALQAQRGFLHSPPAPSASPAPVAATPASSAWLYLLAIALVVVMGLSLVTWTVTRAAFNQARSKSAQAGSATQVAIVVKGKLHPLGQPSDGQTAAMTIVAPSPRGEVGLTIDVPPSPIHFPLIDAGSSQRLREVIITRHHEMKFFKGDSTYLLLPDQATSRPDAQRAGHAKISMDDATGRYQIQDLGSIGGTRINNRTLNGPDRLALANGDLISVGNFRLRFYDERPGSESMF